jgi:hypothetical protein
MLLSTSASSGSASVELADSGVRERWARKKNYRDARHSVAALGIYKGIPDLKGSEAFFAPPIARLPEREHLDLYEHVVAVSRVSEAIYPVDAVTWRRDEVGRSASDDLVVR